ncbi:hypothetical protein BH09ACT7_BH09ACT7_42270 [soil metagenome]
MQATSTADTTVVDLASHPRWRAAQQHSRELSEAMARHPSAAGPARTDGTTLTAS